MPIKYIPYYPVTIEGQAVLDNITRTRRVLRYRDNDRVFDRIRRGLPLFEVTKQETIGDAEKAKDNLLLRGDCLAACAYLKDQGILLDLVYIDPPFASGANYAKSVYLRRHPEKAKEIADAEAELELDELRAFEEKMYGDIWNKEDYLNWMFENLQAIKSVMNDSASIYVHLDESIGHYVKVMLDEVFGEDNFQREIIWDISVLSGFKTKAQNWIRGHDVIFYYTKSDSSKFFNKLTQPHTEKYLAMFDREDEDGRKFLVAHGKKRYRDEVEGKGKPFGDVWGDIMSFQQQPTSDERTDYSTQKPETLLQRIIGASSNENMIVADFFGGSGVTAKVAHDLGRRFVHVDVGVNSLQTARDRLRAAGAAFEVREIQDGVSLFRNPVQTMDKLKTLISGLRNEDGLDQFWEGAVQDSKLGMVPIYLPNLLDHTTKVLDKPLMNRVLREALPELADDVKQVIVYYVDIDDPAALAKFIADENPTNIKIELRDLKEVLDDVVLNDEIRYEIGEAGGGYEVEITRFVSDRLQQKIDEYNAKKGKSQSKGKSEETLFDGDDDDADGGTEKPAKKAKFTPIAISESGLELIEMLSLDCTAADGEWHADAEIKIDKKSFVVRNGVKTKEFWDGKIQAYKKPLRLKVRNIAGDESEVSLSSP